MHAIWKKKNFMIFLLLLNITNIFDWVINSYLIHVLHMKKISERFTKWVHIYMINCIIILMLSNTEIEKNTMTVEISQNSLLSSILYFFYIAELLDFCNNNNKRLNASVFMNNITLLTYKFSTEINCCMLTQAHDQYLNWAHQYDIFFAFEKYKLIHLTHWFKRFNMQVQL